MSKPPAVIPASSKQTASVGLVLYNLKIFILFHIF